MVVMISILSIRINDKNGDNFDSVSRRLCRALMNLRKYTDALVYGSKQYGPSQVSF